MVMLNNFWNNPLFWMVSFVVGYTAVIVALSLPEILIKIEKRVPKILIRILIFSIFIVPPVILPFTEGPKITIPDSVSVSVGLFLLILNFVIRILAQKQIGKFSTIKAERKLVTNSVYGLIRNPLYMSNCLLAVGMAIPFKSLYALLFSIPYVLSYMLIIYFEEEDLLAKYGEEYEEYKKKVPWRIIPMLF
jgi:protein-S-isoprenylcysteine O-methyltransferase Ste14